jgi:type IV pilus assembly protein PilW
MRRENGLPGKQRGLSLLELLIAMALGVLLVAGIGTIYIGSNQTYRVQENSARLQETGRFALEVIGRSLRQAGAAANMTANLTAATTQCVAPTCVAVNGANGVGAASDTLTVQFYAGLDENNVGAWGGRDCTGGFANADTLVTNAIALAGTDLRCTGSVGGAQPLISDIEDLQVLYGVDNDGSADQSADFYTPAPTAAQWPNVVNARVCVLARSVNIGLVGTAQRYLNCGGALGTSTGVAAFTTAGDSRLRRTFVATFNLRNRVTNVP